MKLKLDEKQKNGDVTEDRDTATTDIRTMDLQHETHVSTSRRVASPVQGPTPRFNMAIVQLNIGDENLQGRR